MEKISIDEHIRRLVDKAPPLTNEQRRTLSAVFSGRNRNIDATHQLTPKPNRCFLYRYRDVNDVLLYVGITDDPAIRDRSHMKHSLFHSLSATRQVEALPSRGHALAAEGRAIRSERPLFNRCQSDVTDHERISYLLDRGMYEFISIANTRKSDSAAIKALIDAGMEDALSIRWNMIE